MTWAKKHVRNRKMKEIDFSDRLKLEEKTELSDHQKISLMTHDN
jgi:hypothetical protein